MTSEPGHELVIALRTAARELAQKHSIRDLDQTLHDIVASAVATVPGTDAGSVSMTQHGRIETRQPTAEAIRALDEHQSELDEGPCVQALDDPSEDGLVIAQDFAGVDAERWPRFAPLVVAAGYRSLLSSQLSTVGGLSAALNLYSATPGVFDRHARTLGSLFGAQAAMLLYGADQAQHLQRAVDSRDLIGRAKGILMERFEVDDAGAFRMLTTFSQDTNVKLTVVAQWLNDQAARGGSSPDGGVAPALPAAWTPEADRLANAASGAPSRRGESRPDDIGSEACSSRDVSS